MHNYLKSLIKNKESEVAALYKKKQQTSFLKDAHYRGNKSLQKQIRGQGSVIAEIKRKSPSKSTIGHIPDPTFLAKQYMEGGAAAISVLTDAYGFGGSIEDLRRVARLLEKTSCPLLRKDFMIDPIQIGESIIAGADVVLLIVAVLGDKTKQMLAAATAAGIEAIVEVHDVTECQYAVSIGAQIIGVNNRNLTTFEVVPTCALNLIQHIPKEIIKIAESGMQSPKDVARYLEAGYDAVLVGEALVQSADPVGFIKSCLKRFP